MRGWGRGSRWSSSSVRTVCRALRVTQSTDAEFDSVTVNGVARLRFTPATVAGQPVAVRVEMPVTWTAPPPAQASTEPVVTRTERDVNGERVYTISEVTVEAETYDLNDVDEPPQPLNTQSLLRELERRYPAELRQARAGGIVEVRFRVNLRGEVENPVIVRSSDPAFDAATLRAVRVLRFRPARVNGRAVNAWVVQPIRWSVN